MNRTALLLLVAASMLLTACPRRGGSGGDDDDAAPGYEFGALDTDGDGFLTADDVSEGAALAFTVPGADGDEEIHVSNTSVSIYPMDSIGWSLNGGFTANDTYWWFSVQFENDGTYLEPGVGDILAFDLGEKTSFGRMFRSENPGGDVDIESVDDFRAYGHITGAPTAAGMDPETGDDNGTTATLHGLAFANVSTGADG